MAVYPGLDIYQVLRMLQENMQQQQERMADLEKSVRLLSDAVKGLQERPHTHIDKIEYRFDQLKVETLEGTLNIGITPQTEAAIEDYAVGDETAQDISTSAGSEPIFTNIQQQVQSYLDKEAPGEIRKLENKHHALLGSEYRQMMIEDVKRQIDDRIRIYLKRQPAGEGADPRSVERNVVALLKSDIQTALHNYFKNLPEGSVQDEHGSDQ